MIAETSRERVFKSSSAVDRDSLNNKWKAPISYQARHRHTDLSNLFKNIIYILSKKLFTITQAIVTPESQNR